MRFDEIIGLEETKTQLIQAAKTGKNAHAQLFTGKPGAPNLPLALAYASYLNCENQQEFDVCGTCSACSKNAKYIHPDFHFVFPVSATTKVKAKDAISQAFLKDWRTFLLSNAHGNVDQWATTFGGENKQLNISKEESRQIIRNLTLKTFEGRFKIMLIWLPEFLHPFAANGILKILEEPPDNTVFLLVTNNQEKLLSTILSRTQHVFIRNYNDEEIVQNLVSNHNISSDQAAHVAGICDGDLNKALLLLSDVEDDQEEVFKNWMRLCYDRRRMDELIILSDKFHRLSKIGQRSLLHYGLNVMRDCLIESHLPSISHNASSDRKFIQNFSQHLSASQIEGISNLLNQAMFHLERNGSPKMTFTDTSLHIMKIINK